MEPIEGCRLVKGQAAAVLPSQQPSTMPVLESRPMLSVTNLLCDVQAGNERLRYGHTHRDRVAAAQRQARRADAGAAPADRGYPSAPRPVTVWALTKACNLRCVHCYASASAGPAANELTSAEGMALLDDLKAFGVPAVLFSGGEPLVRADAVDLIAYARSIGLNATLSTNGLLIDDAMADRLADIGLTYAGISIDGIPSRHDKLRGLEGAFAGTVDAIRRCRARGIKVGVRFTVHALNADDLDSIFDICLEQGVERLCVYHLAYAGRGGKMQRVDLTTPQTRQVVDRIFERTRQAAGEGRKLEVLTVGNHADAAYLLMHLDRNDPRQAAVARERLGGTGGNRSGCNIASIDPIGNVHYDQFSWHYSCGNVRQTPFSQIWGEARDARLAILRDRARYLPDRCQSCRFVSICNGNLRTRAETATGDWLGQDPSCYLSDEEIHPAAAAAN
jgi:radical SAM protein with 4Fe4S-binding SPASM domain